MERISSQESVKLLKLAIIHHNGPAFNAITQRFREELTVDQISEILISMNPSREFYYFFYSS
jgi:hypothetical protein